MMKRLHVFRFPVLACLGIALLTGCSRSPRVTFYTLSPVAGSEPVQPAKGAPSLTIAPITLPDLVDRPQLVVRADGSRVDILEMHQWAEPLKSGIQQLLAENLSRLLGGARVSVYPQSSVIEADYRVVVDFQRFESTEDSVTVDAFWTIRRSTGATQKSGHAQIREPNKGEGFDARVSAYNRALFAVSNDIVQAIRTDWVVAR
jgi:uncharacterized lipoprotein YmbA